MNGQITLTHSSNWDLLTRSTLKETEPAENFYYHWIYLTKNYTRANYLQKKFTELHSEDTGVIPPIYSWERFLEKIYDQTPKEEYLLGLIEQLSLVYHIMHQQDNRLANFSLSDKPFSPAIVRNLQSVINALLMIQPSEFPPSEKTDDPSGKELTLIINEYEKLKENNFLDEPDLLNLLIDNLNENYFKRILPNIRKLFWEIDAPIYPLQLAVAEKMCECGWHIHFLLYYADHPDFFKNMINTYTLLSDEAHEAKEIDDPTNLIDAMYHLGGERPKLNIDFSLTKYTDRFSEVEQVVRQIKKDLVDGDSQAHLIIVTAPDTAQYLSLLMNAFAKHGPPPPATPSPRPSDSLPIQHLQLPLELLHENGELSTLKKLLKSPFYSYHDQLAGIRSEAILNSLRVRYDLDIICGQLRKSIEYDERSSSARRSDFLINDKNKLLSVLQEIQKDIQPLRVSFSADDFFDFFTAQFERHSIVSRVIKWKDNIPHKSIADILGAVRAFINGLDVWRNTVNKIAPKSQFKVLQSLDLFRLISHNVHFNPFEPQQHGVQILPIQFVESVDVEKLYVLGLTDNNFPRPDTHLFPDLPQSISHLFSHNQIYEDRRLFLKLLQIPKKEIHLSYPEREGEALNVASTLMLELGRISGKEIFQADAVPVYSKSDFLYSASAKGHGSDIYGGEELAHFERQINITASRNRLEQPFGSYEGDLSKEQVITAYLAGLFETKEFSASALEIYAKNPIQYFFRRVLYVDEPEVFEDWITPIEKGNMVHRALYRYYSETGENQHNLENLLKIAEEEIEKFPFLPSMLWNLQREAFLGNKTGDQKGLFRAFFEYESLLNESSPLRPVFFEVPFGKIAKRITSDVSPGFTEPFEIDGESGRLQLRGIVDRVDMTRDGGIAIVDYKTGNAAPFKDIYQGKSFQLPFYLLAMTTLLKSKQDNVYPLAGCYYKIKDEKTIQKEIVFTDKRGPGLDSKYVFPTTQLGNSLTEVTLDDFLQASISLAAKHSNGIRQGRFCHHVDLKDCEVGGQVCPFEPLCRVNRSKLRHLQNKEPN